MNPAAKDYANVNVAIANDINDPAPGFYRNFSFKRDNSSSGPIYFDSPSNGFFGLFRRFAPEFGNIGKLIFIKLCDINSHNFLFSLQCDRK